MAGVNQNRHQRQIIGEALDQTAVAARGEETVAKTDLLIEEWINQKEAPHLQVSCKYFLQF